MRYMHNLFRNLCKLYTIPQVSPSSLSFYFIFGCAMCMTHYYLNGLWWWDEQLICSSNIIFYFSFTFCSSFSSLLFAILLFHLCHFDTIMSPWEKQMGKFWFSKYLNCSAEFIFLFLFFNFSTTIRPIHMAMTHFSISFSLFFPVIWL